jgi:hypothetical protein
MNTYKNIALKAEYYPKLERLASSYANNNKGKLIELMIVYFETLGINPGEINEKEFLKEITKLGKEIEKLRETTVSFIKQQEKGLLKPLIQQVNINTEQMLKYLASEPLTVKHLNEISSYLPIGKYNQNVNEIAKKTESTEHEMNIDHQSELQRIVDQANIYITHIKDLFKQFLNTGKRRIGGSFQFEEHTINMYKAEFEKLKFIYHMHKN